MGVQGPFVQGIALDELVRNSIPLLGEFEAARPPQET
jgi:hypothetical protein